MRSPRPLPVEFYCRDTARVARVLLGCVRWRACSGGALAAGRIVETEAYFGPEDRASHARRRTRRSEIMYGPPGVAYVYFTYGMHHCLNTVTEPEGTAGAVLLRALEPLEGIEEMAGRRGPAAFDPEGRVRLKQLCGGPARLTQALGIDRKLNGASLQGPRLWIVAAENPPGPDRIAVTPRIGIRHAADRPARYIVRDSPWISGS